MRYSKVFYMKEEGIALFFLIKQSIFDVIDRHTWSTCLLNCKEINVCRHEECFHVIY